jgi:hypothetical protein
MQNIDIYYESIKQVYEQIVNWPRRKPPPHERVIDSVLGVVGVFFALSTIPILPALITFIGDQVGLVIGPINLKGAGITTFLLVWGIAFLSGLVSFLIMLWINDKVDSLADKPAGPPQTLSPEQVTFIAIYEAYKELKVFFVSHVEQHVRNSLTALRRALVSDADYRRYYGLYRDYPEVERRRIARVRALEELDEDAFVSVVDTSVFEHDTLTPSFPRQVAIARSFLQTFSKYAWFQLDLDTNITFERTLTTT